MNTKRFPDNTSLILYFLKGSLCDFFLSMLFAFIVSLLDMLNPRIISFVVDSVIGDAAPALPAWLISRIDRVGGIPFLRSHLLVIAGACAVVGLLAALFRFLFRLMNARAAEQLVKRMRDKLYEHIEKLPASWHSENSTGDIIQRCTSDVETIKMFLSERLTALLRMVILIVMAVVFMAGISPRMTLFASLFIPVIIICSLIFHMKIGSAFEKADEKEGRLSAIAQENLTGVRVVRAFGRESFERDRFETQNKLYTGFWIHLIRILAVYWSIGDLLTGLQLLLVSVLGAVFCVRGQITAGEYIAFVSYNAMLTWPVRALGRVIAEMSKAGISIERLRYIMNAEPEEVPAHPLRPDLHSDIEFRDVSFRYPASTDYVLNHISFTIPSGSTVGILGTTGSGKSTLVSLLLKLYPLEEGCGRILIGGNDLKDIDNDYLRTQIGIVLQEPYLFSRTLEENIRIAAPDSTHEDLLSAAKTAEMLDTIERFPSGFETFVGERGVTLSGGQKQRTAIAQMMIRKTPVMIFDDSLSAVDSETDAKIRERLRTDTADSTVILIAHRISTVMHAHQIIVLDRGEIRERGTHEELLKANGIYRRIYDLQTSDREVSTFAHPEVKGTCGCVRHPDESASMFTHPEVKNTPEASV